ncbi:DNA cytosine methyltransferase [Psychromonas aquimarina]|uniref:DNA cytosine methyltransferase n=1 Tax=Psychromonas aquimarina TaxID=444919 RepID=UPI000428D998|nr:DNA cytosine methyltransferase [Psychromonas aquimarina]
MLKHIDFFSGPGGICTGFNAAGIQTVAAVEKVESCVETYLANHPQVNVIHKDIREVMLSDLESTLLAHKIDIITSGMPCETFSTAGSKSRSFYDHRQQLYYETIRLADLIKPRLILFENVVGILSKKTVKGGDRLIIEDIIDDLAEIGYTHAIQVVLDSTDFGVPQKRKRYFILATREDELQLAPPVGTHKNPVTVKDAFYGLPLNDANTKDNYGTYTGEESVYSKLLKDRVFWGLNTKGKKKALTYHDAPNHRKPTLERFKLISPGENLKDAFTKHSEEQVSKLQEQKILPKKWFIQRNMRLVESLPSKTVTSHCLDELVHPILNRALTVRECARLQSFPDDYNFAGGPFICPHMYEMQDKYEQIGDAVPPLLAYAWANKIKEILE